MKKSAISLLIALISIALSGSAFGQRDRVGSLRVLLSGEQEVPPTPTNTVGRFGIAFDEAVRSADVNLSVFGDSIIAAHLHCAQAGVNGPIIVSLMTGPVQNARGQIGLESITNESIIPMTAAVCGVEINNIASLVAAIRRDLIYVNVHSSVFPGGVIRAQLWGHLLR